MLQWLHPPSNILPQLCFGAFLPTILNNIKYTSFSGFLADFQPVQDSLLHRTHRLFLWTWSSFRLSNFVKKLQNSRGELAKIAQFYLPSFTRKNVQSIPAGLLSPKIIQFQVAVSYSSQKLCNPSLQPAQLPPIKAQSFP